MKGFLEIKFAKRKSLLSKRSGWHKHWVEISNGILNVFETEITEQNSDQARPIHSILVLHLHNMQLTKDVLALQINTETVLLKGSTDSENQKWIKALQKAKKNLIKLEITSCAIGARDVSDLVRRNSTNTLDKRRSLSTPTLAKMTNLTAANSNNAIEKSESTSEFLRPRTASAYSRRSARPLSLVSTTSSITSRRSGASTPIPGRIPNIPLNESQLNLMHELDAVDVIKKQPPPENAKAEKQTATSSTPASYYATLRKPGVKRQSAKIVKNIKKRMSIFGRSGTGKNSGKTASGKTASSPEKSGSDFFAKDDNDPTSGNESEEPVDITDDGEGQDLIRYTSKTLPGKRIVKKTNSILKVLDLPEKEDSVDEASKLKDEIETYVANQTLQDLEDDQGEVFTRKSLEILGPKPKKDSLTEKDIKNLVSPLVLNRKKELVTPSDSELQSKLKKWRESADLCKPVFSATPRLNRPKSRMPQSQTVDQGGSATPKTKVRLAKARKSIMSQGPQQMRVWTMLIENPATTDEIPPELPKKPLRFRKKQLEKLLRGEINPVPDSAEKPGFRQEIRTLLIQINARLRAERETGANNSGEFDELMEQYDVPKNLRKEFVF